METPVFYNICDVKRHIKQARLNIDAAKEAIRNFEAEMQSGDWDTEAWEGFRQEIEELKFTINGNREYIASLERDYL